MRFIAYSVWSLCSPIGISEKLLVRRAALYTHVDYIKGCCAIFSTYINSREGQHFSPCLGCQYIQTLFEGGRIKGRELSLPSSLYLSIVRVLGIVCLHNSLLTFLLQITPQREKLPSSSICWWVTFFKLYDAAAVDRNGYSPHISSPIFCISWPWV